MYTEIALPFSLSITAGIAPNWTRPDCSILIKFCNKLQRMEVIGNILASPEEKKLAHWVKCNIFIPS